VLQPEFHRGNDGAPKFLENPNVPLHMFFDPGRAMFADPNARIVPLPLKRKRKPQRNNPLSRLNSMAVGLAVYASQCKLLNTTQDSLPTAGSAVSGGITTGFQWKVSVHFT
jgi:hypothetical protein